MSVHAPADAVTSRALRFDCGLCNEVADPTCRWFACYPTAKETRLPVASPDGVLALCGACIDEVTELTDAWRPQGRPPVGEHSSIAESFRTVADDCSFCDEEIGAGPILGVESWSPAAPGHDETDRYEHHALCGTCVPIFAEFLRGVGST